MICKNCEENTKGKYCQSCGQKTDTHRLTMKHFISHDVIHGMFHLDSGLPRTIKEILQHPGRVARDYIFGKRKRYYNFFYLLLLIIGLYLFLSALGEPSIIEQENIKRDGSVNFSYYLEHYKKTIIFCWIPVLTLAAIIMFRRLKLSVVEMAIPATVAVIGSSLFNLLLTASDQFIPTVIQSEILSSLVDILEVFLSLSVFLFPLFTFFSFIKGHYSVMGKTWRLVVFYFLCVILVIGLLLIFAFIVSMGESSSVTFS